MMYDVKKAAGNIPSTPPIIAAILVYFWLRTVVCTPLFKNKYLIKVCLIQYHVEG